MKKFWSFLLCLALIVPMFSGMGTIVQAKASGMKVVENNLNGHIGFEVSVSHDAANKTVTIVIDGTNTNNGSGTSRYFKFEPEMDTMAGGKPGWSQPTYDSGEDGDPLKSTIVYTYSNAEELYGIYNISFNHFSFYYQRPGFSVIDNVYWFNNYYVTLVFPMSDSIENSMGFSAQIKKVLDDGSPEEYGPLDTSMNITANDINFYEIYAKGEPLFTQGTMLSKGYDYSYEWTVPSGEKITGQQAHVQTYGCGNYTVKITATRQNTAEGQWAADAGYGESYTAEKTICVNQSDYVSHTYWEGDVSSGEVPVGGTIKFWYPDTPQGTLKVVAPDGTEYTTTGKMVTITDFARKKHEGTYTWTYYPDNQLYRIKSGTKNLTEVTPIDSSPVVTIPSEVSRSDLEEQIQMKADIPGTFRISSKSADGTTTLFEEKTYSYTDTEISVAVKDLAGDEPLAGAYKLKYVFTPAAEYSSEYKAKSGSMDYAIVEKCGISIVQTKGGTVKVNDREDAYFSVNTGAAMTVTVAPETGGHIHSSVTSILLDGQPMENVTFHQDGSATAQFTAQEYEKVYEVSATYDMTMLALKSGQKFYKDGDITTENLSTVEKELFDLVYDAQNSILPDVENAQISVKYLAGTYFEFSMETGLTERQYIENLNAAAPQGSGVYGGHIFGANAQEKIYVTLTLGGKTYETSVEVTVSNVNRVTNASYQTAYTYNANPIPSPAAENFHVASQTAPVFEWYEGQTKLVGAPTEVGSYTLKVTVAETANYGPATLDVPVTISEYRCGDAMLSGVLGDDGWYTSDVTVCAPDGHVISTDKQDWQADISVTQDGETECRYYLKNTENGYISEEKIVTVKRDVVAPDGEVYFEENPVKTALNTITFDLLFNRAFDVVITAADETSGVKKTEYYVSDRALEAGEVTTIQGWRPYEAFDVPAVDKRKSVVYAKVTDHAGNMTVFASNGAVFDITAPVITGITDKESYCTTQRFTVADEHLLQVTVNGEPVTDYVLAGNRDVTYIVKACDEVGNTTTVTVTMKSLTSLLTLLSEMTEGKVNLEDKDSLEDIAKNLESIIQNNNGEYSEQEIENAKNELEKTQKIIERMEDAESVISEIEDALQKADENPKDKEAIEKALEAKKVYDSLDEEIKAFIDEEMIEELLEISEEAVDFEIIKGHDGIYIKGAKEGLSFTADGDFELFKEVRVDGKKIRKGYYTAEEGSTIIVLKPKYLNTLKNGKHKLSVVYHVLGAEYVAECNFRVTEEKKGARQSDETPNNAVPETRTSVKAHVTAPATGDEANPLAWMFVFLLSASVLATVIVIGLKERKHSKADES